MAIVIFSESHSFLSYSVVILTDVLRQQSGDAGLAHHPQALLAQQGGGDAPALRQNAGKVPSYTAPEPQEGLRSLSTAAWAPVSLASCAAASAPRR